MCDSLGSGDARVSMTLSSDGVVSSDLKAQRGKFLKDLLAQNGIENTDS